MGLMFPAYGAGGGTVATAGIAALDPVTLAPLYDDFEAQAKWVLNRLDEILSEAGAELLRVECFLADRCWFRAWNTCFTEHYGPRRRHAPPSCAACPSTAS